MVDMSEKRFEDTSSPSLEETDANAPPVGYHDVDVFGSEKDHQVLLPHTVGNHTRAGFHSRLEQIQYKTLTWPLVAVLMIAEIVSNGMLSLPSSLATVGLVPGLVLIIFLGSFALFTSWLLIKFKLRHPEGKELFVISHAFSSN